VSPRSGDEVWHSLLAAGFAPVGRIIASVSVPAETAPRRSAFTASFLSLLFPGLGQVYGGATVRGLAFAAPAVLLVALMGGLVANPATRKTLLFSLFDTNVLLLVLAMNVLLLGYRAVAIVDAYRTTTLLNAWRRSTDPRAGRPRVRLNVLSLAGLLAVILVASGVHGAVAYYDLTAYDLLRTITAGENGTPTPTPAATQTATPGPSASAQASATPAVPSDRVNILLLGVDRRPADRTFNTDTMIVVSIDPQTKQIAMFSLPRDTVDVPLPRAWPAYSYYGGVYPAKINSLWTRAQGSPSLFPFPNASRGPAALKGILGSLYGIEIPYYVEVDFDGFRKVVDTLGGVTVPVSLPVQDDHYPTETGAGATRLYIPATIQHMSGDEALAYARSRHGSTDFDRAQRQQNVILSLRQQADIPTVLLHLSDLVATLKSAVHTDIPTSKLPQLASLADEVGLEHVRSLVFTPPLYQREVFVDPRGRGYVLEPKVDQIRKAVNQVFSFDPQLEASRQAVADEGAKVRVLNGSGIAGQATAVTAYLDYRGFDASVPTTNGGRADKSTYTTTVITVYNGAEADLTESIAVLEKIFGVQVVAKVDPNVKVDITIITGKNTPKLAVP
jgi:LCP family protein required for cell wall assembly